MKDIMPFTSTSNYVSSQKYVHINDHISIFKKMMPNLIKSKTRYLCLHVLSLMFTNKHIFVKHVKF